MDGIAFNVDGVNATVDWPAVTRVLEDGKAIVLMQGRVLVGVISKRGLGSSTAVEDFKRMVRSYAPDASCVQAWHHKRSDVRHRPQP